MKDILTITKALSDMKDYYGLKDIKHVELNMEEPNHAFIKFVSNKPKQLSSINNTHDAHTLPDKVVYHLTLSIEVSSIFKEDE